MGYYWPFIRSLLTSVFLASLPLLRLSYMKITQSLNGQEKNKQNYNSPLGGEDDDL